MTWFKVDDGLADHPKLVELEGGGHFAEAVALWTLAGAWCARNLTDGNVPCNALRRLVPFRYAPAAEELVRVGLWEKTDSGWRFHDWHRYQPSKAKVLQDREKIRKRVAAHRAKGDPGNDVTNDEGNGVSTPAPVPVPDPVPDQVSDPNGSSSESRQSRDVKRVFEAWLEARPQAAGPTPKLTKQRASKIRARLRDGYSADDLIRAVEGAKREPFLTGDNPSGTNYFRPETIFRDAGTVERHVERVVANGSPVVDDFDVRLRQQEAAAHG